MFSYDLPGMTLKLCTTLSQYIRTGFTLIIKPKFSYVSGQSGISYMRIPSGTLGYKGASTPCLGARYVL